MTKPEEGPSDPVGVPQEVPGEKPTPKATAEISSMEEMDAARDWQDHKHDRDKASLIHWLWMGSVFIVVVGPACVFVAWLCLLPGVPLPDALEENKDAIGDAVKYIGTCVGSITAWEVLLKTRRRG